jgi:hypothetical protein
MRFYEDEKEPVALQSMIGSFFRREAVDERKMKRM